MLEKILKKYKIYDDDDDDDDDDNNNNNNDNKIYKNEQLSWYDTTGVAWQRFIQQCITTF